MPFQIKRGHIVYIISVAVLVATNFWLYLNVLSLTGELRRLETERKMLDDLVNQLQEEVSSLTNYTRSLEITVDELETQIESLTQYFLIGDYEFEGGFNSSEKWWMEEKWNHDGDDYVKIENGTLLLFFNETVGIYGNSGVFQGRHVDGRFSHQLLIRNSTLRKDYSDYVLFPRDMPSGKYWLKVRFRIIRIGFNRYPNIEMLGYNHSLCARINLGITLMCAINDGEFNLESQTLWLDIFFVGFNLNETSIWSIKRNSCYVFSNPSTYDIHAGYWVNQLNPSESLGKWITMTIDVGRYVRYALKNIERELSLDIRYVRVYGFILFVETIGAYANVEYDYIRTYVL